MRKTSNTKQKIFDTAAVLFAERGYHDVSMRDIAKSIGIRTGSIYNHYHSKEEILDALLDRYLDRMEKFYEHMYEVNAGIRPGQKLEELLERLMHSYEPDEMLFMYHLTRVVHHEQFTSAKAADALIGSGYRKAMEANVHFFDQLSEAGYIRGKDQNHMYGELFARISLTFATQFLHPDIQHTIETQEILYRFAIGMVVSHEKFKDTAVPS